MLDRIIYGRLIDKVHKTYVKQYWDGSDSAQKTEAFCRFCKSSDVKKAFDVLSRNDSPDIIDNVFTHAAHNTPPSHLFEITRCIVESPVYLAINSYAPTIAKDVALKIAERCPTNEGSRFLSLFDSNTTMQNVLGGKGSYHEAKIFAELMKDRSDEDAIVRLKASPTWKSIDHKDNHFVEWIDDQDARLLRALLQ